MPDFPPDGWTVHTGTWGTDIDANVSTVYMGDSSIEFKNTAVASKLLSDFIEIPLGQPWAVDVTWRRTANTQLNVAVEIYDAAKALITTVTLGTTAPRIGNNIWESHRFVGTLSSDNRTRFVKVRIGKADTATDSIFIGALDFRVLRRAFRVIKTSDQTGIVSGAETQVVWNSTDFDFGGTYVSNQWNPAADNTGSAHARKHHDTYQNAWQFGTHVRWASLNDQSTATLSIRKNGTINATVTSANSGTGAISQTLAQILFVREEDTVDVSVRHTNGADRSLQSGATNGEPGAFYGFELYP